MKLIPRFVVLGSALAACEPSLNDTTSLVTSPTVLAIQSVPAEATPASVVRYHALVAASPGSDAGVARLQWDYCNARNPLSNLGPVSTACVQPGSSGLERLGAGLAASGQVPSAACGSFGPNAPPATDGGTAGEPVDPDSTGGYYQPVTLFLPGSGGVSTQDTLYFLRLSCGFSGANEASQGILTSRYHVNENPEVSMLVAGTTTFVPGGGAATSAVTHAQKLSLSVSWPTCPLVDKCGDGICGADESMMSCAADCTSPKGCAGAERYVNFNVTTQTVVDQREGIHVSWYASAGTFDQDRTGNDGTDDATTSANGWTPPLTAQSVTMWVVLHDDRGGIGWQTYALDVK